MTNTTTTTTTTTTTATTTASSSLHSTVSSIVDGVVENAVSTSSLQAEKRNVQAAINKLVSRVHDDALSSEKTTPTPVRSTITPETQTRYRGVPIGDHRLRKCPELPITWTQAMDSLTLNVDVPSWVTKNLVVVQFTPGAVKAAVNHQSSVESTVLFDGPLVAKIAVDGCIWALEEVGTTKKLIIELEKARLQWWARLFMSDDPREYIIVNTKLAPDQANSTNGGFSRSPDTLSTSEESETQENDELATSPERQTGTNPNNLSHQSLEDGVADFVDEVVNEAASTDKSKQSNMRDSERDEKTTGASSLRQQRVLTRADLPKMVERCKAVIAQGGQAAYESALQLATFYHHGLGVEQNDAEAVRLYKYALENGILDPSAAFQLGLIYNQGARDVEPDAAEAVRWWRVSASLRNPVAMFNLGVMYMNGSGCEMDPIMATRWFQQAQSLDPRLQPPQFSRVQLEERIATAMKLRKQRLKKALPPEEKQRRKELALQKVRTVAYGTAAVAGIGISVMAMRYWWRNRL